MKRFLKNILLFGVCFIPFATLPFFAVFFLVDETAADTMMGELNHKLEHLASERSPKIVFIGGSGCSHGINSELIEKEFGLPVVNMGLHADLGFDYQLSSIDPFIGDGDYVIMIPEYPHFSGRYIFGRRELLMVVSDIRPSERSKLNVEQWRNLLEYMPEYGLNKIKRMIKNVFKSHSPKNDRDYGSYKYDDRGDMIGSRFDNRNLGFKPAGKRSAEGFPYGKKNVCVRKINEFISRHQNAKVVVFPAALQDASFDNEREYIMAIKKVLIENGTPYVAKPERYRMENEECWDTPYHLNAIGIKRRTQQLIEDLKPIIN